MTSMKLSSKRNQTLCVTLAWALLALIAATASVAADLSGTWRDGWDGGTIQIKQTSRPSGGRAQYEATLVKENDLHSWKYAIVYARGDELAVSFKKADRSADGNQLMGRVHDKGNKIRFATGSTWTRMKKTVAAVSPVLISGSWTDSNGDGIELFQIHDQVVAIGLTANVKQYWHMGEGKVSGSKLVMVHSLAGRATDTQTGSIVGE